MKLLAIADLHLAHRLNREALDGVTAHPDDWLILAGDIGERVELLELAIAALAPKFAQLLWVPGNHDLWSPADSARTRGQARYDEQVAICRRHGVITPEDPYVRWPGDDETYLVPMFLLFDYTFHPPEIEAGREVDWARASGVVCGDEQMLDPAPWASRTAWCHARCDETLRRLEALPAGAPTVLINHWPLRYDLARPPRIPRFSIWCGTSRTEDWGRRFHARAVVSGHLHMRTTLFRHGVRYEEVSLGYPRDWRQDRGIDWYLRPFLPAPALYPFAPPRDPFGRWPMTSDPLDGI
jgi:3',5'-cyclic AMP phosphodiesterase CpdA